MKLFGYELRRAETRSIEDPRVGLGDAAAWAQFFGMPGSSAGVSVTVESALGVPAVWAAVSFLSRTMASLPLHVYRRTGEGRERVKGPLQRLIHERPNPQALWSSFKFRHYGWWQTFTGGRQFAYVERNQAAQPAALWPLDPTKMAVERVGGIVQYAYQDTQARRIVYDAADIVDLPFALRPDMLRHYSPIHKARNAIGSMIAMETFASNFFRGGGVPPLALEGPLPQGADALKRAMDDINRSIKRARESDRPYFGIPPGHKFTQVGFEPEKGQMTEARKMQVVEIARAYQLPPVFLQDLERATFTNSEQQDIFLVKHLVSQWAQAYEDELNLKLFPTGRFFVEHNLDGLMRGDFKTRADAVARLVQGSVYTPAQGAEYMGQETPTDPATHKYYMQGATVPLDQAPTISDPGAQNE